MRRSQRSTGGSAQRIALAVACFAAGAALRLPLRPEARAQRGPDPVAAAWASREACLAAPRPRRAPGIARIATWNVRWFPDGAARAAASTGAGRPTDVAWLACAIASLRVDAIALQEILLHARGRAALAELLRALDRRTGGRWEAHDDGCPEDHQHLVVLVDRSRARVDRVETTAALHPTGELCAHRLRPGLAVTLAWEGGLDLTLLTAHLDSGTGARDHGHRRASMAALGRAMAPSLAADPDLVLLGDLNTMGCRECTPRVRPEDELAALEVELAAAGLSRAAPTHACSEYAGAHPALLDHVAVTQGTRELRAGARAEVSGPCAVLACRHARLRAAQEQLSDHCPIVIELDDVDRDP